MRSSDSPVEITTRTLRNGIGAGIAWISTAACSLCPWRMEFTALSSLSNLANIEDLEARAAEHEEQHQGEKEGGRDAQ